MNNKEILQEIKKLRQELHKIPELSFAEEKTKELLMDWLYANTDLEIVDRGLWFYAFCRGNTDSLSSGTDKARIISAPIAFRAILMRWKVRMECLVTIVVMMGMRPFLRDLRSLSVSKSQRKVSI